MTEIDPLKKIENEIAKLQKQLNEQRAGEAKERGNIFQWSIASAGLYYGIESVVLAGVGAACVVWSAADMTAHSLRAKTIKKRISKLQDQVDAIELARAADPRWINAPKAPSSDMNADVTDKFNKTAQKMDQISEDLQQVKKDLDQSKGPDFTKKK